MGNVGKHVLIFDEVARRRSVLDEITTYEGRWATLATNLPEALAVLRSALHPLIVMIGLPLALERDWDGSPLVELVCQPDIAATHAFIIIWGGSEEPSADVREQVAQSGAGFVKWLRLPTVRANIAGAQREAQRHLEGSHDSE